MKAYREVLGKKNENHQATGKLITDLIKAIRENSVKEHKEKVVSQRKEEEVTPRRSFNPKGFEKKIKEMQSQKVKQNQETVAKVEKIQVAFEKVLNRVNKSTCLTTTLHKFETNLDAKIDEIISKAQIKLDNQELTGLRDEVICDLKLKLQEVNNEN
jgi:hypothetical protein